MLLRGQVCCPPAFHGPQLIVALQGSYGRVFLGRLHETPCAVKVLLGWQEGGGSGNGGDGDLANGGGGSGATAMAEQRQTLTLSSPLLADLRREAGVMAALHHPNCVQLMGICADPAAIVTGARWVVVAGLSDR